MGEWAAAFTEWLRLVFPRFYEGLLVFAGMVYQSEKQQRQNLEHQIDETQKAEDAARRVDDAARDSHSLDLLRQRWRQPRRPL